MRRPVEQPLFLYAPVFSTHITALLYRKRNPTRRNKATGSSRWDIVPTAAGLEAGYSAIRPAAQFTGFAFH